MRPNVLLLMIDALRADRCWGDTRQCRTPVLDEIVARSTVFQNAFSVASVTTVSTASILTGTYPFVHGIHLLAGRPLNADIPTLAEVFRANGYYTWAEATGPLLPLTRLNRGFDEYRNDRDPHLWLDTPWGDYIFNKIKRELPKPWFGFLHLWELHHLRRVTNNYDDPTYGQALYDRAVSSLDNQLGRLLEVLPEDVILIITGDHGEYVPEAKSGELVVRLKRSFRWVKKRIPSAKELKHFSPKVFKALERLAPENKNQLHFDMLGHGYHIYDYLVHVPLIFYAPGHFPENLKISQMISHIDLFPTTVSGLDLHTRDIPFLQGIDLMPLIRDRGKSIKDRELYMEVYGARTVARPELSLSGLRTERYKYVRGVYEGKPREELYDLVSDPREKQNLARDIPEIARGMEARLSQIINSSPRQSSKAQADYSSKELAQLENRLRDLGYLD